MIEDPLTTWPGQFPYRVLADFDITPRSSRADVEDVAFTLMAEGRMNPTTQQAWRQLRDVSGRMLVDLLLYDIDQEAEPREPVPPEVTEALTTIPVEVMACLADELTDPPPAEPGAVPSFVDDLIRFDR